MTLEEYNAYTHTEPSYSEEFDGYTIKGMHRNLKGFVQYRGEMEY